MKKRRRNVTLLVAVMLMVSALTGFANTEYNKKSNQLKEVNNSQKVIKNEIKVKTEQQKSVAAEIEKLQQEIDKTEEEISATEKDIQATQKKIEVATQELAEAEANIEQKQDLLGNRLAVMYKNGNIGYFEVLLSSKSFPELLSNLDMLKLIVQHDVDLLKYLEEQRNIIEDKKVQLETQKNHLLALQSQMKEKKQQLVVSRSKQDEIRKSLIQDQKALEAELDKMEKQAKELEAELIKLASPGEYIGGVLRWPVPGHSRISSPFGNRLHPILKVNRFHTGIDIPAPTGTTIIAAGNGTVKHAGDLGSYGRTVIIDHGGGTMTLYAHNSKLLVSVGQTVTSGQKIAQAGSTGMSTGSHLHFEVRENGKYVDPLPYVKGN